MRRILAATLSTCLVGCQSTQLAYQDYANALARIAEAQASVQREQAQALKELAHSGDATSKTVAVIMLGIGAGNGGQRYEKPAPPQNEALQWASIILPSISTLALGYWGYQLGKTQSNNAANVSIAGYGAMEGIAGQGFNAVGQFKPQPFDWSGLANLRPNETTNTTTITVENRDGAVSTGSGNASADNRPVAIVPPVVPIVPVVVTNP